VRAESGRVDAIRLRHVARGSISARLSVDVALVLGCEAQAALLRSRQMSRTCKLKLWLLKTRFAAGTRHRRSPEPAARTLQITYF
jgi:hypothetical protein